MSDEKQTPNYTIRRLMQEVRLKEEARTLTDGELARELIREVWAHAELWTRPAVLIDEAITRLKRADTRRRWEERKARRAKAVVEWPEEINL